MMSEQNEMNEMSKTCILYMTLAWGLTAFINATFGILSLCNVSYVKKMSVSEWVFTGASFCLFVFNLSLYIKISRSIRRRQRLLDEQYI